MRTYQTKRLTRFIALLFCPLVSGTPATGVPIVNDPNGFEDFPWETILSETEQFIKIDGSGRIQAYKPKKHSPYAWLDGGRFVVVYNV
jgi:hypothetical protein